MKNAKREMKRKGFTLVELLIVIVVIGVLSAMMMLSSTEAVSSAKAADIVSDLRNLKTAALAWYADHLDYVEGRVKSDGTAITEVTDSDFTDLNASRAEILKYMNNDSNINAGYKFAGSRTADWYVYYDGSDVSTTNGKINEKLESRASSTGLLDSDHAAYKKAKTAVYMFIR